MQKRIISFVLALYYLSVSLWLGSGHFHDHSKGLPHQCVACLWHLESVADAPTGPFLVTPPVIEVSPAVFAETRITTGSPILPSDRGPPVHS